MGIKARPEVKFALIHEATLHDNNQLSIRKMCEIAGVSRSGYYNWCASEGARKARDEADQKDFELIMEAYRLKYSPESRHIKMNSQLSVRADKKHSQHGGCVYLKSSW